MSGHLKSGTTVYLKGSKPPPVHLSVNLLCLTECYLFGTIPSLFAVPLLAPIEHFHSRSENFAKKADLLTPPCSDPGFPGTLQHKY